MTVDGRPRIPTGVLGEAPIRELEIALAGSIVGPGEPNYETARRARGGTHSAAGFSTCDDGIVLDLAQLNDVQLMLAHGARTPCRAELSEHIDWAGAARNALAIYGKGGMYVNFPGDAQEGDVDRSYPSQIRARLQAVKNQYDPLIVFRFNINISQPHGERRVK